MHSMGHSERTAHHPPLIAVFLLFLLASGGSSAQSVLFHDDFNRPNSASVGNVWSEHSAEVSSVAGGSLRFTASALQPGMKLVRRPSYEAEPDQEVRAVFTWRTGARPVVCARVQNPGPACYAAVVSEKSGIGVGRIEAETGALSLLAAGPTLLKDGSRYALVLSVRGGDPAVLLNARLLQIQSTSYQVGQASAVDDSPARLTSPGTTALSAGASATASFDAVTVFAPDARPSRPQPDLPLPTNTLFTDGFDRPASATVGAGWVETNPVVSSCAGGTLLLTSTGARFAKNMVHRPPAEAWADGEASVRILYRPEGSEIPMLFVRARASPSAAGYLAYVMNGRFGLARLGEGDSSFTTLAWDWAPLGPGRYRLSLRCAGANPVRLVAKLAGADPLGAPVELSLFAADYSEARITVPGVPALSIHSSGSAEFDDFVSAAVRRATIVPPNSPDIRYYGRWNSMDPHRRIGVNPGIGLVARFTGKTCRLLFDTSANADPMPTVWVRVDAVWTEHVVAPAIAVATEPPESEGPHQLEVVFKGVDPTQNRWLEPPVGALYFRGLELEEGAQLLPPPPAPPLKMEFVGDSVTEGYAAAGAGGPGGNDASKAFSTLTGRLLNSEYWITGFGGHGVSRPTTRSNVPKAALSFPWIYAGVPRPAHFTPHVVVINEGTNDADYPDAIVRQDYLDLVAEVRKAYPAAFIFCVRPFTGAKAEAVRDAAMAASAFDPMVFYVDTAGWLRASDYSDGVHPNLSGHMRAALLLASVIRDVLDRHGMVQ